MIYMNMKLSLVKQTRYTEIMRGYRTVLRTVLKTVLRTVLKTMLRTVINKVLKTVLRTVLKTVLEGRRQTMTGKLHCQKVHSS